MIDYNHFADEYARNRQAHPGVVQNLLEIGEIRKGRRVLEVGCGTGNYIRTLAETSGCQAWGIDPSESMLAKARERSQKVRYLPGRAAYFRSAWPVIARGGRLCTVTDSEEIIRQRAPLAVYFPETVEADLKRYPPLSDLIRGMEETGFQEIREVRVDFAYLLRDIQAFRQQAYSCLHLIPEDAFRRGFRRMEADLEKGPIECTSSYILLWGMKS